MKRDVQRYINTRGSGGMCSSLVLLRFSANQDFFMAFSWDNVHVTVDPSVVLCEVHHINIARATKVKKKIMFVG